MFRDMGDSGSHQRLRGGRISFRPPVCGFRQHAPETDWQKHLPLRVFRDRAPFRKFGHPCPSVVKFSAHLWNTKRSSAWKRTSSSRRNRRCGAAAPISSAREPNTNVCPVCLGLPGVLPVANDEALRLTVLTGFLLNCEIPRFAKFDRKSYFYPDMPKNYQITQYDKPSTANGYVEFEFSGGICRASASPARIWRRTSARVLISSATAAWTSIAPACRSWKLFPSRTSPARTWPTNISTRSRKSSCYGGVSDCDMEKGMVRCDVNVSVRPVGTKELGAKIEIKNMNSFSGVRRALEYEIPRQIEVRQEGRQTDPIHAPLG